MSQRDDAPRSLLFGLLALQTGLVNQAAVVAAFHAWTLAKERPMAEILIEQGALDGSRRALIEGLVGEHLRMHGGDPEQSLAALGAGASTRASLTQIGDADLTRTLARVGLSSSDVDGVDRTWAVLPDGSPTSTGPRYRIVRNHAKGGLGEVFVAIDTEFNREVAIKEIQHRYAHDPDSRARFLLEAEVTGGLEHPGIVPVYGLGTYADGRPYYAMRFIRGDSLKEAIAAFHADDGLKRDPGRRALELRKLLRRFLDVCDAIEYAHQRGVLHRDLKPGNIMVGRYGETLVVDWGLAKVQGRAHPEAPTGEHTLMPASGSGSAETVAGHAIGTPAYMSPEQAAGDIANLGPRSDVYSLGATLYCLLTGKPPFEGSDLVAMLRDVQKGGFPRPRTLDPTIDTALEAVCLKAMALNPSDRYDSPRALADDIERWEADEPVRAHPESVRSRLGRWGRRNRAWVRAGGASLALVMVIAVLFAVEQAHSADRLRREQKKTTAALGAETEQRKKATAALVAEKEQRKEAETQTELANGRLYFVNMNSVQRFWEDYNPELFRLFLREQLPEYQHDGIDRRGFEWYYWERKLNSCYYTLNIHGDPYLCLAFSPDFKRIAFATEGPTVTVYDAELGLEAFTLRGHSDQVKCLAFSPDGKRIASAGSDATVKVWDAETGWEVFTLKGHTGQVYSIAFSPDGKRIVSASEDNTVKVWDAVNGREAVPLRGYPRGLFDGSCSPDGKRIVSATSDLTVKVWEVATGQEAFTLKVHNGGEGSPKFSPDGKRIVSVRGDKTVRVWDAVNGREAFTIKGHIGGDESLAFSPDGKRIASANDDKMVKVFDAETGQEAFTLKGHTGQVRFVAFSPDGKRIASTSDDSTVKVWDAANGQEVFTIKGHIGGAGRLAFSPDGKRIASEGGDYMVKVWDAVNGQEPLTLKGHTGSVNSVTFSPDGKRIASASRDATVKVWDAVNGQEPLTLKGHTGSVNSVAFSPDGRRIASASTDESVKVWDIESGRWAATLMGYPGGVYGVAFSPDGMRIALGGSHGTVRLWDAVNGHGAATLKGYSDRGHSVGVTSVAFSPEGKRIASASYDQTMKVWDVATGQEALTLIGHSGRVNSVSISPAGKRIASASSDSTVKLWDAANGQVIVTLKGHTGSVNSVAFSPDGKRIASASDDHTVKVWDVATGQEAITLKGHAGPVKCVAFSPDGKRIVSASDDNTVKVWDARPLKPVERNRTKP